MNTITSSSRTLLASAILSALAFSVATVSHANEVTSPPQAIVKFGDLNVSTSQGAAVLYSRIEYAAKNVCSHMYLSEEAYRSMKYACLQKVIRDAVIKVDRPALSAVFESRYGATPPVVLAAAGIR